MATKPLKSIKFPGLSDTYTVPQVDATLTTSGAAADAKIVGDDLSDLNERLEDLEESGVGISDDLKQALLQLASKVAYIDDDGQDYYDDLYDALYPPTTLQSISAVYTQSGTIYDTATLASLKSNLVVTAHYDTAPDEVLSSNDYSLSGTLEAGTSTITVIYYNKTTTFTVTVTANAVNSINAVYTQNDTIYTTDSLDILKNDLVVTATWLDGTTETVSSSNYTISGSLTSGTSTITVSYGGKTTTFNVTVTAWDVDWEYTDGSPLNNSWINTTSVTGSMETNGYQMGPVNTGTSGCTLAHSPDVSYSHGVIELDFTIIQMAETNSEGTYNGYCIFMPGVRLRIYNNKLTIEMSTTNTLADRIDVCALTQGNRYTLRIEYNKTSGGATVWVDGTKVYETSNALNANTTRLLLNATQKNVGSQTYQNPAPATMLHAIRCKEVA